MGPGHGFQVSIRDHAPPILSPNIGVGEEQPSSSSSARPRRDADSHPLRSLPGPSHEHDVNTDAARFMTLLHLHHLDASNAVITLVNSPMIQPSHEIAQALGIQLHQIEAIYPSVVPPTDTPPGHMHAVVQRVGDVRYGTTSKLLIIDIVYHQHPGPTSQTNLPRIVRMVERVGMHTQRSSILLIADLYYYCSHFEGCVVFLDGLIWPPQDRSFRNVQHGSFALIEVPPPAGFEVATEDAVAAVQDVELNPNIIQDLLVDDETGLLQVTPPGHILQHGGSCQGDLVHRVCTAAFRSRPKWPLESLPIDDSPRERLSHPSPEAQVIPVEMDARGAVLRHFADLNPSSSHDKASDTPDKSHQIDLPPVISSEVPHVEVVSPETSQNVSHSDPVSEDRNDAQHKAPLVQVAPQQRRRKNSRPAMANLPGQTKLETFFQPKRAVSAPAAPSTPPVQHKCSDEQAQAPPTWTAPIPRQQQAPAPQQRALTLWQIELGAIFEELAVVQHRETGPVMSVDVWYVHHTSHPECEAPRLVVLDNIHELWYADICAVWLDRIRRHEPLRVHIVSPKPAYPNRPQAPTHIILEQGMRPDVVAIHFTAAFHGGHRIGIFLRAESVPAAISEQMMIDKHQFNRFCNVRPCRMFCGRMRFWQHEPEPIDSGLAILLDIGDHVRNAPDATREPVPDVTNLMQGRPVTSIRQKNAAGRSLQAAPQDSTPQSSLGSVPSREMLPQFRVTESNMRSFRQAIAWMQRSLPTTSCATYGHSIMTWFTHPARQPSDDQGREVVLQSPLFEWPTRILQQWIDLIDSDTPVFLHVVWPMPPGGPTHILAHVLVTQMPPTGHHPILITINDMAQNLWRPARLSTTVPTIVQAHQLSQLVSLHFGSSSSNAPVASVTHGTINLGMQEEYPVLPGFGFEVTLTPDEDVWADSLSMLQLQFRQVHAAITSLHVLTHAPEPAQAPPVRCQADQPTEQALGTGSAAPPPTQADLFRQALLPRWRHLAALRPPQQPRQAPVLSWYIDHVRAPQCLIPRRVWLNEHPAGWQAALARAWLDTLIPSRPIYFYIVTPQPPNMESDIVEHVLVVQQPVQDFRSVLITTFDSSFPMQVQRQATIAPQHMTQFFLLGLALLDRACAQSNNVCTTWLADIEIGPRDFLLIQDGCSATVAIHRQLQPVGEDADFWGHTSPAQRLPDARFGVQPVGHPHTPKSPIPQDQRVPILLDPCLPHSPSNEPVAYDESLSTMLWAQHPDWQRVCKDSLTNTLCALPQGFLPPQVSVQAITQGIESGIDPDAAWYLELYIDGATSSIGAAWSLVAVAVSVIEVRGHTGNPWNELADGLAKFALGDDSCHTFSFGSLHHLATATHDLAWNWMSYQPACFQACLPDQPDSSMFQFSVPHVRLPLPFSKADVGPPPVVQLQCTFATVNVLALDKIDQQQQVGRQKGGRTARLDAQFHQAGVHVAGIQESRTLKGRFQSDNYHIFASGCQGPAAARLGCELWIHKRLPFATSPEGQPICFADAQATVQMADARRLFVHLSMTSLSVTFVVLHGPCLQKSKGDGRLPLDDIHQWWTHTTDLLQQHCTTDLHWVFVDANAPLATSATPFYGMHQATACNSQTAIFEDFLHNCRLYVPSTFKHLHDGPGHTWTHSSGSFHRIDFILCSEAAFPLTKSTCTMTSYDGTFAHEDHIPVILHAQGWLPIAAKSRKIRWDEAALLDPARCALFQEALATLPLPAWQVHQDSHAQWYEYQVLQLARQHFEVRKGTRTRPTLQPHTLDHIAMKRHVLDCGRAFGLMTDPDFKSVLRQHEHQVRDMVRHDIRQFFDQVLVHLQEAGLTHDFKAMYRHMIRLGGGKRKRTAPVRPLPMLQCPDGSIARTFTQQQEVWMHQFAIVEAGLKTSWEALQQHNTPAKLPQDCQQYQCFPSAWDLQRAVAKFKRGKTPGPNQLTPSILKAAGSVFARQFSVLTLKCASHASEPLSWKGGNLIPLHKGKGPAEDPASFRSIFISNYSSKLYHRTVRQQIEQLWEASIDALQLGGRKKMGTDVAHHLLDGHQHLCKCMKLPTAVIFFDLRAAFYSVLRQSLTSVPQEQSVFHKAMEAFQVNPADLQAWLSVVQTDNALPGATKHLQYIINDTMTCTHFAVEGLDAYCHTTRGTRPGDPLGDILFNTIMSLVLRDARQYLLDRLEVAWMGAPDMCESFACAPDLPPAGFLDLAFVDDAAVAVHAPNLDELHTLILHVVQAMRYATFRRGMELNFDRGKTEVMWSIMGRGSRALKATLAEDDQTLKWSADGHDFHLHVTQSYKHLGSWLQAPHRHARDIQHRASSAKATWGAISKQLYSKSYVSLRTKTQVFQSLSLSRLLFNAHTWSGVTPDQLDTWQNHMRKPIGLMVKHLLQGIQPTSLETQDLFALADLLSPKDQLHLARLRYCKRLLEFCPRALWIVLFQAQPYEHNWLGLCTESFAWFRQFYARPFGPSHGDAFADWIPFVALDPNWKGRLKKAAQACIRYRRSVAEHHLWQKRFDEVFVSHGGILPHSSHRNAECWQCDLCLKTFASRRALASHAGRVHGYRRVVKYFAIGDVCLACGKWYHHRKRLIEHLKDVSSCLDVLQHCFPPLDDACVQQFDLDDHQHTLQMRAEGWWSTKALLPVRRIPCPLLPPAQSAEARLMLARWSARVECPGSAFDALQGRQIGVHPVESPEVRLFAQDLPAFVFQSAAGPNAGNGRFSLRGLAREYAILHIKALVVVHFFSGYRRNGDLHQILEQRVFGRLHVFLISVDMCMQRIQGNLATSKALQFWVRAVDTGQVCGAGGGPPCETFSAARLMEGGPPPLRSEDWPLGFTNLRPRQWTQTIVGSRLVRFMIEILLRLAAAGGFGFCEHPQYPLWSIHKRPASIWSFREIRLLRTLECFGVTSIDQCICGSPAKKPTTFLHLRLPKLRDQLLCTGHGGRCPHGGNFHQRMAGRDETGAFRTAQAKVYPPDLNRVLADAMELFIKETFDGSHQVAVLPPQFSELTATEFAESDAAAEDAQEQAHDGCRGCRRTVTPGARDNAVVPRENWLKRAVDISKTGTLQCDSLHQ
eukprot:s29_g58.t1